MEKQKQTRTYTETQSEKAESFNVDIEMKNGQPIPRTFEGMWRLAQIYAKSGILPKGIDTPERAFLAMQLGSELGISYINAIQNIAVINGRPSVWGDLMLGLVMRIKEFGSIEEELKDIDGDLTAICTVVRVGHEPVTRTFSMSDARKADLTGKDNWKKYPKRMVQMRARSFALRDLFPDVLKGLYSIEEMMGVENEVIDTQLLDSIIDETQKQQIKQTDKTKDPGQDTIKPFTDQENDYIDHIAETKRIDKSIVKERALSNRKVFSANATAWANDNKTTYPWKNKRSKGENSFKNFINDEPDYVKSAPREEQEAMHEKWKGMYAEPFPYQLFDPPEEQVFTGEPGETPYEILVDKINSDAADIEVMDEIESAFQSDLISEDQVGELMEKARNRNK